MELLSATRTKEGGCSGDGGDRGVSAAEDHKSGKQQQKQMPG